jgi:hypothetical protein
MDSKNNKGIDGFAELVEPGSAADHPDNPNQNIAKTPQPFEPSQGLAAFNGGMGPVAQAAAEEEAGQDHDPEDEKDLCNYYQDRITLEDMEARKQRRLSKTEKTEAARQDTYTPTD